MLEIVLKEKGRHCITFDVYVLKMGHYVLMWALLIIKKQKKKIVVEMITIAVVVMRKMNLYYR